MKQKTNHPSGGKLRALFCTGLAAALAAGIALNSTAATVRTVEYDVSVWSSSTHTVTLAGSDLYVWGTNDKGQFPNSVLDYSPEPIQVQSKVVSAAASEGRTLTVSSRGELRTYGLDPVTEQLAPVNGVILTRDAAQVAASDSFAAYISNTGALYTWGKNDFSQLGNGTDKESAEPVMILDSGVKKVSLGSTFGLALMEDGSVYGWGDNSYYQLGITDVAVAAKPVKIAEGVKDIRTGDLHSCLLMQNGSLWTCGDNTFSQTGVDSYDPTPLTQILTGIRSVTAGSYHNFAVSSDGAVYAWGYGISGQLGNGSQDRLEAPTETSLKYVQVFACDDNTFGISSDGSIYSFGNNTNYRLGKSNGSDSILPVKILDEEMNWVYTDEPVDDRQDPSEPDNGDENGDKNGNTEDVTPPDPSAGQDADNVPPSTDDGPAVTAMPFVSGYENGTFQPNRKVTRAEFLRMAVSALCADFDSTKGYGACSFSDVPLDKWYEKYIAYAERKGYVSGYQDGTFHPDEPISREEISVIIARIMGLSKEDAPSAGFTDVPEESWQTASINALANKGILNGDGNGKFRPKDPLARKEAIVAISRAAGFKPDDATKAQLLSEFTTSPFSDVPTSASYYVYLLRAVGSAK